MDKQSNETTTQQEDAFEYAEKQLRKEEINQEQEEINKYLQRTSKKNKKLLLIATILKVTRESLLETNRTSIPLIEIERKIKYRRGTIRATIEQLTHINIIKKENKTPPPNPNKNKKSRKLRVVISLNTQNPNYVLFVSKIKQLINKKRMRGETQKWTKTTKTTKI